jgi:hypothetical protein
VGKTLVFIIDLILIIALTWRVIDIDNDKMYIVFIFGYGVIVALNLALWTILALFKSSIAKDFGKIIIGLIILFIPLWLYVSRA